MALTDESGGTGMVMPVAPMYGGGYGNNGGFGWGGDWAWIIILLLAFNGGWGNNGWNNGYNNQLGYDFPWLLNGQNGINNNVSDGFRTAQLSDGITSIRDGINGISTQLCNGFNGIGMQMANNTIADLERSFAAQTANTNGLNNLSAQLANCCCENRAATQDVKYTIATEACATRANSTANTQAILDKLCALELDGYKRENDQLRAQLNFANLQASQVAQTAELRQSGATQLNNLVAELRSCPIPAQPVCGNQPIFTCSASSCGCGCNG